MLTKIRSAILATTGTVALLAGVAPSAQAGLLSLAPGSCKALPGVLSAAKCYDHD